MYYSRALVFSAVIAKGAILVRIRSTPEACEACATSIHEVKQVLKELMALLENLTATALLAAASIRPFDFAFSVLSSHAGDENECKFLEIILKLLVAPLLVFLELNLALHYA